jgi:hypothetical protein
LGREHLVLGQTGQAGHTWRTDRKLFQAVNVRMATGQFQNQNSLLLGVSEDSEYFVEQITR